MHIKNISSVKTEMRPQIEPILAVSDDKLVG